MADFLTTQGTSYHLENIIINATKWLVLISPYLDISENFLMRLQEVDKRKVKIYIIYGKDDLKPEEKMKLQKLENLSLRYCKNLHAKCFLNENSMIITSMNMYEFSEKTNIEMGVLIHKDIDSDQQIYEKAMSEVKYILYSAESEVFSSRQGYCIRCEKQILYDPDKPYCRECFYSWLEWGNPLYIEKYCHSCGKRDRSSMLYPLCRSCFQKSQKY